VREGDRLIAAAPLSIITQSCYGLIHRNVLTFLSSYSYAHPLDQGPLIDADVVEVVLPLLAEQIVKLGGFDVVSFELFGSGSLANLLLKELGHFTKRRVSYRVQATSHVVNLPSTYENFITTLGSSTRKNIRKYRNRFKAKEDREIQFVASGRQMIEMLEALRIQKKRRLNNVGHASTFDDDRFFAFLNDVCLALLREGRVLGLMAQVNGHIAATQLVLMDQHGYSYAYNSSFDLDFDHMRLHYVLENARIEEVINRGYRTMDLSTGHEPHKRHWSRDQKRKLLEGILVIRPIGNAGFWLIDALKSLFK
jgi:hypothetical protein